MIITLSDHVTTNTTEFCLIFEHKRFQDVQFNVNKGSELLAENVRSCLKRDGKISSKA